MRIFLTKNPENIFHDTPGVARCFMKCRKFRARARGAKVLSNVTLTYKKLWRAASNFSKVHAEPRTTNMIIFAQAITNTFESNQSSRICCVFSLSLSLNKSVDISTVID